VLAPVATVVWLFVRIPLRNEHHPVDKVVTPVALREAHLCAFSLPHERLSMTEEVKVEGRIA
jgi:hypothetical protein